MSDKRGHTLNLYYADSSLTADAEHVYVLTTNTCELVIFSISISRTDHHHPPEFMVTASHYYLN